VSDWDAAVSSMADALGADFRDALREASEARTRTYYDAEADRAAAEAYYTDVGPAGLGDLLRATHHVEPRYKPSLELYPWVDLQPDGRLRSLYTGEAFEPEELIEADLAVLQQRAARLSRMRMVAEHEQPDTAAAEREVEALLPFNCEHVVPQSWFAKAEPMRGDLHHLFACEARCNSFRGNTPFAEFPDFPAQLTPPPPTPPTSTLTDAPRAVRTDCGKSAENGFEPAGGKGAAARAAFYFRLRYPDHISAEEMPAERWDVLLTWHEQDPVSTWELHRNAAIFERQGNRNPAIDHPEWAPDLVAPGAG
jgi:endonuclease I